MNAGPSASSTSASNSSGSHNSIIKVAFAVILLFVAGLVVYSIYVAVHEPDPQETVILGQTNIASGSPAGIRILVRNRVSRKPIPDAVVELSLKGDKSRTVKLGSFRTDATGSLDESIKIPNLAPGEYQLVVDVTSPLGHDHVVKKVRIQHPVRLLLSSDKPIYQPGQTIHVRSLLLNSRTQQPLTNETVVFEVSDPKGNKVFKRIRNTSNFGIASSDFVLASELNLGRYQLRALAGATSVERTVEVKRYVLPKFRIQLKTEKPYYLPGETVSGSVVVRYFFGKSVADVAVKLHAATLHEKPVAVADLQGRTDASGTYRFHFALPDFFVGMPQKNEQAFLDLTAEVRDTAGHGEDSTLSLSVARQQLEVMAIPEAGELVPGVENILYVLTEYPDGRPAPCEVFLDGNRYQADAQGLCAIRINPADLNRQYEIQAIDPEGRRGKLTYRPAADRAPPAFLLRSDEAVYQAGQTARISVLSPEKNNTVFIDLIKDGQTVLTKSIALINHKAEYALPLPPSLVGALKLNAYIISETGEDRGCMRIIFVNPASGLQIAARLSKPVYRPGEIARLDFSVTDAAGHPAPAALGITAVDESVFALHEKRPGLLKQFLDVENDLLKPRFQIKFFDSPASLFQTGNQSLAAAYFASLEEQRAGRSLDDMVKSGYLPRQIIQRVRQLRGTPAYEQLRRDPQYAPMVRLLDGAHGIYSLRETTGPVKLQAAEAHRKAYFKNLERDLQVGFLCVLLLSPVLLLIYYSRPGAGIHPEVLGEGRTARYAAVASSLHNLLAVLTLLPMICYPFGYLLLEQRGSNGAGWVLLAFETIAVALTLASQLGRIRSAAAENLEAEMASLRVFIWAFFTQFVVSRAGLVLMFVSPPDDIVFPALWFFASLFAPLMVQGALGSHVRRQSRAQDINERITHVNLVEVLLVICILFILAAMLLPALSKAKARAQRISLVNDLKQIDLAKRLADEDEASGSSDSASPRIRRDFPETLLWQPELITDDNGKATLEFPLADSITTWRTSIDGISAAGKMGSLELPIPAFQDFFVDADLPVSLSLGDEVSVPVACYNYLKEPQEARLTLAAADWFDSPVQNLSLHLGPNEVKSVHFPIKVLRVGNHLLRLTARGTKLADAIEREVRVVPTGRRMDFTRNGVLNDTFAETFAIPANTIPGSQSLWVKFYPSRFSEVVGGLESVFQAPHGCFEQTSSTTYPNVLVLAYLKRMGRLTPEIEIKARKFINAGYQRLLTFEVPGGGFEWFGDAPANICLTAYGILEFTDMARVHPIDDAVIERARHWLFAQQNSNGSWDEIHRGWTWAGRGSMTAFVAWALAESGDQSAGLDKALDYLRNHPQELSNLYAKALAANAFLARNRNDAFGRQLADQIKEAAIHDDRKMLHWSSTGYSITFSHDSGMDTECTALCAMALMKAGTSPQSVRQALTWISNHKFADGTLGSTQATILAMRALLEGSTSSLGQESETTVAVLLNGEPLETFRVNKDNSDVMKQIELTSFLRPGANRIQFRQNPSGELPFQLAGAYWLPGTPRPVSPAGRSNPLEIGLKYDRTTLAVNDQLRCSVTVKNNTDRLIHMAIVDLGIPPGFEVDASAFEAMQEQARIAKYEVTGNQVILYLRTLSIETPFVFTFSLRAKYPLRVQTPRSAVYEYYEPRNRAKSRTVALRVLGN